MSSNFKRLVFFACHLTRVYLFVIAKWTPLAKCKSNWDHVFLYCLPSAIWARSKRKRDGEQSRVIGFAQSVCPIWEFKVGSRFATRSAQNGASLTGHSNGPIVNHEDQDCAERSARADLVRHFLFSVGSKRRMSWAPETSSSALTAKR